MKFRHSKAQLLLSPTAPNQKSKLEAQKSRHIKMNETQPKQPSYGSIEKGPLLTFIEITQFQHKSNPSNKSIHNKKLSIYS